MARELGAPYYETSVYTFFGVEELFENAVRAALCSRWIHSQKYFHQNSLLLRRTKRFWKTNLKSVCRPLMQVYGAINSRLHFIFIKIFLLAGTILSSKTKSARANCGQLRLRPGSECFIQCKCGRDYRGISLHFYLNYPSGLPPC